MLKQVRRGVCIGFVLLCGPLMDPAAAECLIEGSGSQGLFKTHLSPGCTKIERESRAIDAGALMAALKQGQTIDLEGVVIRGNLTFEALPVSSNPPVIDGVISREDKDIRVVTGGVSIVNSTVQGTMLHRSVASTLVFRAPVRFAGTTFEEVVRVTGLL